MPELGWVLGAVKLYAWAVFLVAWAQMSWTDWNSQKIRNSHLKYWARFLAGGYAVLAASTGAGLLGYAGIFLYPGYYLALGAYAAFSAAAAYALWALRVWPAGDVKLFVLLALLFPLMTLPETFRSGLRFLEVLINTFIPASVALFALACRYVYRTRFAHQRLFLRDLGARREAQFFLEKGRHVARLLLEDALARVAAARADPKGFAVGLVEWLMSVVLMALLSYYLRDVIRSALLKTLLFFALFFLWSRVYQVLGRAGAQVLGAAAFAVLLLRDPDVDWWMLVVDFSNLSIFSLCIRAGMGWAVRVVAGETALVFYPVAAFLLGMVPWGVLGRFRVGEISSQLLVWAGMGLFFGLALVFVRIWDDESYQSLRPDQVQPYMTLGPAILARMARDEEFFEEHFSDIYADGLTPEQVEALRDWCGRNAVERVPLAPTMSFAAWIFFGYFLTWLAGGHVLAYVFRA